MPLTIQGNWTITVITKNPQSLPQRFIVSSANTGNGIHVGFLGNTIAVTGNTWLINIQANEEYDETGKWLNSSLRKTSTRQEGGYYVFEVESEDLIQDNSFDDLVLRFSQLAPITPPPVIIIPPVVVTPTTPVNPPPRVPDPVIPVDLGFGKIYTKFKSDEILPLQKIKTTYGIWLDSTGSLNGNLLSFFTGSNATSSFNLPIYQTRPLDCYATQMLDIAYGHKDGSGSKDLGGNDYFSPSKAIYGQYRNLCLNNDEKIFKLGQKEIKHFYVINVKRDRMGDRLDDGLTEINLHHLSGSQYGINNTHTGSNVKLGTQSVLRLIDDSKIDYNTLNSKSKEYFYSDISQSLTHKSQCNYIVSGNLETGIYNDSQPYVYGLSFPNLGIFILDADMLDVSASFLTVTGSDISGDNPMKLFKSLSGSAMQTDNSGDYLGLKSRKVAYEYQSKHIVRVKNFDYNFSNNPSFQTGSEGYVIPDFRNNNPQTFVTEIGLYNDNYELLAVGKVNYPKPKNYVTEALYEVRLKYK